MAIRCFDGRRVVQYHVRRPGAPISRSSRPVPPRSNRSCGTTLGRRTDCHPVTARQGHLEHVLSRHVRRRVVGDMIFEIWAKLGREERDELIDTTKVDDELEEEREEARDREELRQAGEAECSRVEEQDRSTGLRSARIES